MKTNKKSESTLYKHFATTYSSSVIQNYKKIFSPSTISIMDKPNEVQSKFTLWVNTCYIMLQAVWRAVVFQVLRHHLGIRFFGVYLCSTYALQVPKVRPTTLHVR